MLNLEYVAMHKASCDVYARNVTKKNLYLVDQEVRYEI